MVLKKVKAQKRGGCHLCGKREESLSKTLPVCLECLRSGKREIVPFIEKAHLQSLKPFRLVKAPPLREASLCLLAGRQGRRASIIFNLMKGTFS